MQKKKKLVSLISMTGLLIHVTALQ